MNPVLFQSNGEVLDGQYLPGQYQWAFAVQLVSALLDCEVPPAAGTLTLTLVVGGVPQSFQFTIAAGATPVMIPRPLSILIPANTPVRWLASFTGLPEQAAAQVAITVQLVEQSISQVTAVRPNLTVQYASGQSRLTLFNFNPSTGLYSETVPGISSGLALIVQSGQASISITVGTATLSAAGGVISAPGFIARGGVVSTLSPRLLFCVNNLSVATLSSDALRVVNLTEGTPAVLTSSDPGFYTQFQFWSAAELTAVLCSTGTTGLEFEED